MEELWESFRSNPLTLHWETRTQTPPLRSLRWSARAGSRGLCLVCQAFTNMCPLVSRLPCPLLQGLDLLLPSLTLPHPTHISSLHWSPSCSITWNNYLFSVYIAGFCFISLVEHFIVSVIVLLLPFHMLFSSSGQPFWRTFSPLG